MTARVWLVVSAVAVFMPSAAVAQSIGIRGYVAFGVAQPAAQDTFDAISDTTQQTLIGGGVQVTGIWKGIFADVGVMQLETIDGERVSIDDGDIFEHGIPLEVKMRPFDIAGGWRLAYRRVSPYVGAGVTFLNYEETSEFADSDENVEENKSGPLFLGGVDIAIVDWLHAGGEFRYRRVKGIFGEGGVSEEFGEDNAGGFSAAVRISIGR